MDGLGSDRLPVLSLYGDGDIYGPNAEHLTTRFPTGQHIVLPGCGHLPWLLAPQDFQHSITQFYDAALQPEARLARAGWRDNEITPLGPHHIRVQRSACIEFVACVGDAEYS